MVRKVGKFSYDISRFEKEAKKLFPNEDIVVGALDDTDEKLIQDFLDSVLEYESEDRN